MPTSTLLAADPNLLRRLGMTQTEVLSLVELTEEQHASYGLHISKALSEQKGYLVNPAQIFVTLKRLKNRGLIKQIGTRNKYGSPPMKLWGLTPAGQQVLDTVRANLATVFTRLQQIGPQADDLTEQQPRPAKTHSPKTKLKRSIPQRRKSTAPTQRTLRRRHSS